MSYSIGCAEICFKNTDLQNIWKKVAGCFRNDWELLFFASEYENVAKWFSFNAF